MTKSKVIPSLENPFEEKQEIEFAVPGQASYQPGLYEETLKKGHDLQQNEINFQSPVLLLNMCSKAKWLN